MKIVEMQDVSYVRNGKPILEDVSWTINQGEHWALLGANGSGKTTLLKLLTAYEWVTTGRIQVLGKTYGKCHVGLHRKQMGWVSASLQVQLPRNDSVKKVVASGLEASFGWYGEWDDAVEEATQEAMDRLQIQHLQDQSYATLSQGEQKRTQIARAVVHKPNLLILDEPCNGLDPVNRIRLLDDLTHYIQSPSTPSIIYVTHHIEELQSWMHCTHLLKEGKTLAKGKTKDIVESTLIGETFDRNCVVKSHKGNYRLSFD